MQLLGRERLAVEDLLQPRLDLGLGIDGLLGEAAALLDQQGADLVALPVLEVFQVEVDLEPLAGPVDQPLAVVTLVAAGVAGGEVRKPGHHRILDLLLVVGRLGLLVDELLELFRRQFPHRLQRELDAELALHPGARRRTP